MEIEEVDSIEYFLKTITSGFSLNCCSYRGVSDSEYELIPNIARVTTLPDMSLSDYEHELLNRFESEGYPYLKKPVNYWQVLIMAQEHGVPTRLLDWTTNPLVGLFFATVNNPEKDGAVYQIQKDIYQKEMELEEKLPHPPYNINEFIYLKPRHYTKRIENQDGVFTLKPDPLSPVNDEDVDRMRKIIIPKEMKPRTLSILQVCGCNWHKLFGNLDYLSKHIIWKLQRKYFKIPE